MGSVTKTTMEGVGDVMKSTSYYFNSFEDFMEYERVVNDVDSGTTAPISIVIDKLSDTTAKAPPTTLVVGKQYRVVEDISEHCHNIGEIVTVMEYDEEDCRLPYRVEDSLGNGGWIRAEEVEEV